MSSAPVQWTQQACSNESQVTSQYLRSSEGILRVKNLKFLIPRLTSLEYEVEMTNHLAISVHRSERVGSSCITETENKQQQMRKL